MSTTGNGGIYNTCYATIYDNGGPDSNYHNFSNSTITIAPLWVQHVDLYFEMFDTEIFFDSLSIYDGPGTTFPLIGTYSGNVLQGQTVSSTGSSITLSFGSDDIQTGAGFKIWVSCLMSNEITYDTQSAFVYPNPANSILNIEGIEKDDINSVFITDMLGKMIYRNFSTSLIDIGNLSSGVYGLNVVLKNGQTLCLKWIKQ